MSRLPHEDENQRSEEVIVVLGCRVRNGEPGPALLRRLEHARTVHRASPKLPLIMSGGRSWEGHRESDVMERWWRTTEQGTKVCLEGSSLTTKQNAREVARLCRDLGYRHVVLVTCDFHMPRAARLFENEGTIVTRAPAMATRSNWENTRLKLREWGARLLERWETLLE